MALQVLLPLLLGSAAAAGLGAGTSALANRAEKRRTQAGNVAVEQEANRLIQPKQQPQIETPDQAMQALFYGPMGALPGIGLAPPTPPPVLPIKEIPSQRTVTYHIGHGGKLSADVAEDPDARAGKRRANFMQAFTGALQSAPATILPQDRVKYGIEAAIQQGYLPDSSSWIDFYEPDPAIIANAARAALLRGLGEGMNFNALRSEIDAAYPGLSKQVWDGILEEAYGSLLTANVIIAKQEGEGADLPPESQGEYIYKLAASRASDALNGYVPPKEKLYGVPAPTTPTGRQKVSDLKGEALQAVLSTGFFTTEDYVTPGNIKQAMEEYQEAEVQRGIRGQVEAATAKKVEDLKIAASDLKFFMQDLLDMSTQINTAVGPSRIFEGLLTRGAAFFQTSEYGALAADFLATRQAYLAKFARAFGEVGVLTEFDIKRAEYMLPTVYDSKRLAQRKLERLARFVEMKMQHARDEAWRLRNAPKILSVKDADRIAEQVGASYSRGALQSTLEGLKEEGVDVRGLGVNELAAGALPQNPLDLFPSGAEQPTEELP